MVVVLVEQASPVPLVEHLRSMQPVVVVQIEVEREHQVDLASEATVEEPRWQQVELRTQGPVVVVRLGFPHVLVVWEVPVLSLFDTPPPQTGQSI
jgi:hypothetical protein